MTFEHSMLRTATLCLIAFGAVMVYSASSGTSLLNGGGDSSQYLKRYLISAALGLVALAFFSRNGVATVAPRYTPVLLIVAIGGLAARAASGLRHRGERRPAAGSAPGRSRSSPPSSRSSRSCSTPRR